MTERRSHDGYDLSLPVIIRLVAERVADTSKGSTRDVSTERTVLQIFSGLILIRLKGLLARNISRLAFLRVSAHVPRKGE